MDDRIHETVTQGADDTTATYKRKEPCEQDLTLAEQKKLVNDMPRAFGYMRVATADQVTSGLEKKSDEAAVVQYIFDTFDAYTENPPEDLVQAVLHERKNQNLTYDQAKEYVSMPAIQQRIADEVNAKWPEAGKWFIEARLSQCTKTRKAPLQSVIVEHSDMISKEVFEQAQAKMKEGRGKE